MSHDQKTLFKDVVILDEVDIVTLEIEFYFIYNDETGGKEKVINTSIPVRVERLVTFVVDSVVPKIKLPRPKINSFKSVAVLIRNVLLNLISKPTKYNDMVYDFRGLSPNNIAHLMMHIIPFCLHVRNVANQDVCFLLDKVAGPYQKLLDVFKIVPIVTNSKIEAPLVKIVVTRGFAAYSASELFEAQPCSLLPNIYDGYSFSSGLESTDKIFIARRGARGLINTSDIERFLKRYGYKTIYMEDYPIEVQLGIASEAKDIVAVHGASMGMLVLNKKIKSLIEIMPPNVYHDYFPCAIGANIKKHIQVMPYFDARTPYNDWSVISEFKNKEFSLDVRQLEKALKQLS